MKRQRYPKYTSDKNHRKVGDHWHYTGKYRSAARVICDLKNSIPKEIHCDYHFIIKEPTYKFEAKFNCLGEII